MASPAVSVIIPAYNAAETIASALASIRAQSYANWEVLIVDDGSEDGTVSVAQRFAREDSRFRVVLQPHEGVSAARNAGIRHSDSEWLLFLDADDLLMPQHLEKLVVAFLDDPELDLVYCGWREEALDGGILRETQPNLPEEPFAALGRQCIIAIHCALFRRRVLERVGLFDTSMVTCEDWDLWQRIARSGARFGTVRDGVYARYRLRPGSAAHDYRSIFVHGLQVISRAHGPAPGTAYPEGLPATDLAFVQFRFACWCAGLAIGQGRDALNLLDLLADARAPELTTQLDRGSFESIFLAAGQHPDDWAAMWPSVEPRITEFLGALEVKSQAFGLVRRFRLELERMVLESGPASRPLLLSTFYAIDVEAAQPILDVPRAGDAERLHCNVLYDGVPLGTLELPFCDGVVASYVLTDAIVNLFAWQILRRFFERTLYPEHLVRDEAGTVSYRGVECSLEGLGETDQEFGVRLHEAIGWQVFLQEVWDRPGWPGAAFYDPDFAEGGPGGPIVDAWGPLLRVEISRPLPNIGASGGALHVVLAVGGTEVGVVRVRGDSGAVPANRLRAAINRAVGFELCRACVREVLVGRAVNEPPLSLRSRLSRSADTSEEARLMNGVVGRTLLGRRLPQQFGTSASRRAMLPRAATRVLLEMAREAGEAVVQIPSEEEGPPTVLYAPEIIANPFLDPGTSAAGPRTPTGAPRVISPHDRGHFEQLFSTNPDPWTYTSDYEQVKYDQTLSLLQHTRIERALELACAEGHFTEQLASRVNQLVAADISKIALERTAARCSAFPHVGTLHLDLFQHPLPSDFDLIVCSEVLYYSNDLDTLRTTAAKIADSLKEGGYLLAAHAHLVVDEPDEPGFDWAVPFGAKVIGETLCAVSALQLVKELRTPLYRIQLFQRATSVQGPLPRADPEVVVLHDQPTPVPPIAAASVRWQGAAPSGVLDATPVVTDKLPILLYHRVAPDGPAPLARYRVTPEAFEEQLSYLADAGYYSVSPELWRAAMQTRRALPGRAVLITFDDGYEDFATHAWPLLRRYGFTALVFVVSEAAGASNSWDSVYGEEVPLLGWGDLRRLGEEGVLFGSHACSHRPLTALSTAEVAAEAARSRVRLLQELQTPIHAFSYPYGQTDPVIEHLVGACGYTVGFSCRPRRSEYTDSLLSLPRLEVSGKDTLRTFIGKL